MNLIDAYKKIGEHYKPGCASWYDKQGKDNAWTAAHEKLERKMQAQLDQSKPPYGEWVKEFCDECSRLADIYSALVADPKIDGKDASLFGFMYENGDEKFEQLRRAQEAQCIICESTSRLRAEKLNGKPGLYCQECLSQ